jgi:hypothetical protein
VRPIELLLVDDNPGDVMLVRDVVAESAAPVQSRAAWDAERPPEVVFHPYTKLDLIILV